MSNHHEITVTINEKLIKFGFSIKTKRYYKQAFGRNPIKDMDKINARTPAGLTKALTITFPQLFWAMAKTSNPEIPVFKEWHDSIGQYDPLKVIDCLQPFLEQLGGAKHG